MHVRSGLGREFSGASNLMYNPCRPAVADRRGKGRSPAGAPGFLADPHSVNGQYFNRLKPNAATSKRAPDAELGKALWERTETLLGLHGAQWTPQARTS
jgi:hypothetical protein